MTTQIGSAVYVAGATDRGASADRSQTEHLSFASRHRLRHYRTVFGQTPSAYALWRAPRLKREHELGWMRSGKKADTVTINGVIRKRDGKLVLER